MKKICVIFFLTLPVLCSAQTFIIYNGDTINRIDTLGKKQGYWIKFGKDKPNTRFKEDQKMEEGIYINNRKTGLWKEYYCNGNLKNQLNFVDGRPNGEAVTYYENGMTQECGTWQRNHWVGNYYLYDDSGNLARHYEFDEKGKRKGNDTLQYRRGPIKEYRDIDEEGKGKNLAREFDIQKLNGHHTLYISHKQIIREGEFENGKLIDGKAYLYNEDGILTRVLVFKNGKYISDKVN